MPDPDLELGEDERVAWAKRLMRLPKAQLADRLQETLEALDRVSKYCANCNVAAYYGGELLDKKKGGAREKLDYIERQSLGGWGYAVGTLEVGRDPLPGFGERRG